MLYNVLQMLERNAGKNPDKIALSDGTGKVWTYGEYMSQAKRIGTAIDIQLYCTERGVSSPQPVAVLMDRNALSVIAFLGVVYSGNFYVPVDATMPEERIRLIFDTLKPVMVLDARGLDPDHAELRICGEPVISAEAMLETEIDEERLTVIRQHAIDTDPLYCIFTSGSTGVPKGVLVSHRGVLDLVQAFRESFGFPEGLIFGNQAPFDFDVSVKDIYNALFLNATVDILPKKLFKLPLELLSHIRERGINILIWAVSAMRILADFKTFDNTEAPTNLQYVMFSGEVMPVKALNYWMDHVPQARYVNLYGPTEITCNCTYYEVNRRHADDEMLPVGRAFANSRVFLKDDTGAVIRACDTIGEICVAGSCLALGYWNNPERTEAAFIQNPVIDAYPSKIYATGDMGYWNQKGELVFASRRDFQIKHMGHRIELGEIEAALNAIPFIHVSCCLFDQVHEKIVCFYEAEQECRREIVLALSKKLPKYMWPNVYQHYEKLPMNKNGKIDRVLLRETLGY